MGINDQARDAQRRLMEKIRPPVPDTVSQSAPEETYMIYKSYKTYMSYTDTPERFANMMITLCFKQGYLLDQLLRAIEKKFVEEGGFREKLFRKRMDYRNNRHI